MIANLAATDVKPGSMGRPLPGIEAADRCGATTRATWCAPRSRFPWARRASWRCGRAGPRCSAAISTTTSATGAASPAAGTSRGDLARRDGEGYFWFVGRGDDVIKSAGHLIGPFEVESVLLEHPAVAEAGVIGKPDPVAGQIVKAFVVLGRGHEPSRRAAARAARLRPAPAGRGGRAPRDRVRRRGAAHAQRQDHAPAAAGPRARAARRATSQRLEEQS